MLAFVSCLVVSPTPATAVAATDLADLSLEQLGQVVVTSVARRAQRIATAGDLLFVIL
jgi:hypothetical protein